MFFVRVDNRLVHGQVIETWLPFTRARLIAVVNNDMASDIIRQEIVSLAIPTGVEIAFLPVDNAAMFFHQNRFSSSEVLVLFSNCTDAKTAYESGFHFRSINLGNLHYGPGKRQVCRHVALSPDDEVSLAYFSDHGVKIDYRCVPTDPVQVRQA
ncbi:PTS sugar transporter subunit IIB [Desulfovibrio inopinatus]|uniref:PTS sugar transporter subunit IIB n=1 Tax=Desulfovibrio inopinatus TaxID=102109 RepID=UPI00040335BD|nr:PTS sugar transporter subunit IIB [Desulfovibrio inopinatus]